MQQTNLEIFLESLSVFDHKEDSYDTSLFASFSEEERKCAEDALIKAASEADPRALVTIGKLKLKRAIETVKAQTKNESLWVRFSASRALLQLDGSVQGLWDASGSPNATARFGAIMELATVPGQETEEILLLALEDSDRLVRSLAFDTLIERHELIAYTKSEEGKTLLESPLKTLSVLLGSQLFPLWSKAAFNAKQLFIKIAEGVNPEDLDLVYVSSGQDNFRAQVRDSYLDENEPFCTKIIHQATGHDRFWAEVFLAMKLDPKADCARSVNALVDLKATWVLPALEVLLGEIDRESPLYPIMHNAIACLRDYA